MKQITIKQTKNGTDYVNINFQENGKRVGGFNASIKVVKSLSEAGFLGELGVDAVTTYIDSVGHDTIIEDMRRRALSKASFNL